MLKTSGSSSLLRGLAIMQAIVESSKALSVAELVEKLGLPKPTVHRIAIQLEEEGFLQRNPVDKRFIAGTQLKDFALNVLSNASVGAARHAILEALSHEIGETCYCTMLDGNHTVYFDPVECAWPIKVQLSPGANLPLHATASGKLFLAHMSPQDRKRLLHAAPLSRETDRTLISPELLEEELKKIHAEGVGQDNEEFLVGMVAIALPVFDKKNRICFTVGFHAPTTRMHMDDMRQHLPSLRRAAKALSSSYCSSESVEA